MEVIDYFTNNYSYIDKKEIQDTVNEFFNKEKDWKKKEDLLKETFSKSEKQKVFQKTDVIIKIYANYIPDHIRKGLVFYIWSKIQENW